jgi:hypothetical protein
MSANTSSVSGDALLIHSTYYGRGIYRTNPYINAFLAGTGHNCGIRGHQANSYPNTPIFLNVLGMVNKVIDQVHVPSN